MAVLAWAVASGVQTAAGEDLTQMSLEQLMQVEVTSVSKKEKQAWKSAAAVYVITQDDIRRSGAVNIPDVLRMVPGLDVARIDANTWAISIRGFNYRYASYLLVLIDGRSVYTPGFSGVYWDQQNVPLQDIDRIEVIRGPGGTVWGANAVNGVINIITKHAKETQGSLVSAGTGSKENARGLMQYGGAAGASGFYRVYGNYFDVGGSPPASGAAGSDGWHGMEGGFRSDWTLSQQDTLTVQGDYNGTSEGQTISTMFLNRLQPDMFVVPDTVRVGSENLLGRWQHTFSDGSEAQAQVYYDRFRRFDQALDVLNTGDADFQYHFHAGARNDVVAGAGYRASSHSYSDGYEIAFGNGYRWESLYSAFIQDEVSLTKTLALTAGSKIEHNAYTGWEYEPSAQIAWTPSKRQTLWASAARAIRQPSWMDNSMRLDTATVPIPGAGFGVIEIMGANQAATRMLDFEIGYRAAASERLSFDLTAFVSRYNNLRTEEPGASYFTFSPAPPHLVIPYYWEALAHARDYGGELAINWNVTKQWRISPGFSFLEMQVRKDPSSQDTTVEGTPGDSPKLQAQIRSLWNLRRNLQWDTSAYIAGALRGGGPSAAAAVPSYTRVDTRLGWRLGETMELSVTGQNLLAPRHVEFSDGLQVLPTQVERAFLVNLTRRF